jgi:hypothetical protein
MFDDDPMRVVYLVLVLVLALSSLAAYKLSWKKSAVYVLIWGSIFVGLTLFIGVVMG